MKLICLLILICVTNWESSLAFQVIHISGTVIDVDSDQPIQGASVGLDGHSHIGTNTNSEGRFNLQIPAYVAAPELVFFASGYREKKVSFRKDDGQPGVVALEKNPILLKEVIIKGTDLELEKLCRDALKNIPNNYPNTIHYIRGLYRKLSTDSSQYTGLVEAVLAIKDPGYQKSSNLVDIQPIQVRSSDNIIETDSIAMKIGNMMSKHYGTSGAESLQRMYESNYIRLYMNPYTIFSKTGGSFEFSMNKTGIRQTAALENLTILGTDTIYHILVESFAQSMKLDEIRLSINSSDKAIVQFTRGIFDDHVTVTFSKANDGKYYLKSIYRVSPHIFQKQNQHRQYYNVETFETELTELKRQSIPKITTPEDHLSILNAGQYAYDKEYWDKYFADHPSLRLNQDVKNSLEVSKGLESQYRSDKK